MEIKQGDLFWIDLGEPRESEPGYRHPYVVVQNNVFNKSKLNTVVLCAITSNVSRASAPGNVLIKRGDGNIPKTSVVNITQIVTLNKSDLIEKIGTLPKKLTEKILEGINLLITPKEI
jgi:mRNA interferase MazF